jgi:hypothetical protein
MTRRELAALIVAVPAAAQTASVPPSAQPPDPLSAAKDDLRQAADRLAGAKLEITTEPAFRFKA